MLNVKHRLSNTQWCVPPHWAHCTKNFRPTPDNTPYWHTHRLVASPHTPHWQTSSRLISPPSRQRYSLPCVWTKFHWNHTNMSKRFVSISHFDLVSGTSLLLIKTRKILLDFGIFGIFKTFFVWMRQMILFQELSCFLKKSCLIPGTFMGKAIYF